MCLVGVADFLKKRFAAQTGHFFYLGLARFESIEKRTAYWMDNVLPCLKKTYLTPTVVQRAWLFE